MMSIRFPSGPLRWGWEKLLTQEKGDDGFGKTGVGHMITVSQNKPWDQTRAGKRHGICSSSIPFPSPAWILSQPPAFGKVNDRAIFLTLVWKDCACQFSKNDGCWYLNCQQLQLFASTEGIVTTEISSTQPILWAFLINTQCKYLRIN